MLIRCLAYLLESKDLNKMMTVHKVVFLLSEFIAGLPLGIGGGRRGYVYIEPTKIPRRLRAWFRASNETSLIWTTLGARTKVVRGMQSIIERAEQPTRGLLDCSLPIRRSDCNGDAKNLRRQVLDEIPIQTPGSTARVDTKEELSLSRAPPVSSVRLCILRRL